MRLALAVALGVVALGAARPAHAFCGFFVGKADARLFNKSSQVAIVRDGDHTVITMGNDFRGPLTEFALVVPVPAVLTREQIHVGDPGLLARLDSYSAPRLVEYNDPDPCEPPRIMAMMAPSSAAMKSELARGHVRDEPKLGVTVEAEYTVGEYDIVLLSAQESSGLETWLRESGYRIPQKAADALSPYVKQKMKFFVAKVNLKEQKAAGFQSLRPIQIAFDSPRFMLPIRLGMANGDGAQDLLIYAITRKGRVESTNYPTVRMPSDAEVPEYIQKDFGHFYKDAFEHAWRGHGQRALLTEYVWNMGFCDPCSAPPLETAELQALGVFWLGDSGYHGGGMPLTLTRLHVRYDAEHFPEDLAFQDTGDQQPFQGRYVLRHPWKGETSCAAGREYLEQLRVRHQQEARTLAQLTGWKENDIQKQMGSDAPRPPPPFWKKLWQ